MSGSFDSNSFDVNSFDTESFLFDVLSRVAVGRSDGFDFEKDDLDVIESIIAFLNGVAKNG